MTVMCAEHIQEACALLQALILAAGSSSGGPLQYRREAERLWTQRALTLSA